MLFLKYHFDWSVAEWRNLGLNVLSGVSPDIKHCCNLVKNIAETLRLRSG